MLSDRSVPFKQSADRTFLEARIPNLALPATVVVAERGAKVTLITGRVSLPTPRNVKRIDVDSADQMHRAVMGHKKNKDAIVMAAAVADYTPARYSSHKIKKETLSRDTLSLELKRTTDILRQLGKEKHGPVLVGFALETDNGLRSAKKKLKEKNLDLIILNNPLEEGAGFDTETNVVTMIPKRGKIERLKKMSKFDVANRILDRVAKML